MAKNVCPVNLISVVSKVFGKFVNNDLVDHLQKCDLLFYFQNGFRSSRSTADLLTDVSDRIARAFNRSRATEAVVVDISKAFNRVRYDDLLHKVEFYEISGEVIDLISSFLSNKWLQSSTGC